MTSVHLNFYEKQTHHRWHYIFSRFNNNWKYIFKCWINGGETGKRIHCVQTKAFSANDILADFSLHLITVQVLTNFAKFVIFCTTEFRRARSKNAYVIKRVIRSNKREDNKKSAACNWIPPMMQTKMINICSKHIFSLASDVYTCFQMTYKSMGMYV